MQKNISWKGKVVFTVNGIDETQYNTYFDTSAISFSIANKTLAFYVGTPCALPVDFLNSLGRTEAINRVSYGDKWLSQKSYANLPSFRQTILCESNGEKIDYFTLPYTIRRYIAEKIINDGDTQGLIKINC